MFMRFQCICGAFDMLDFGYKFMMLILVCLFSNGAFIRCNIVVHSS
jgi:hypothetical protein